MPSTSYNIVFEMKEHRLTRIEVDWSFALAEFALVNHLDLIDHVPPVLVKSITSRTLYPSSNLDKTNSFWSSLIHSIASESRLAYQSNRCA